MPLSRLARNAGWNLAGQVIPLLSALVSIPILIHAIGDGRFGFLSIAWVLVGYFGLFDLGMGRAITHGLARRLSANAGAENSELVWTGLCVLAVIGVVVGIAVAAGSRFLVFSLIRMPGELRDEAVRALIVLSASLPFVLLSAGLRGALEARQAFKTVNLVIMPVGALLYIGPAIVAQFSVSLSHIFLSLLIVRAVSCVLLFLACTRVLERFLAVRVSASAARELFSFGGWMTISNIASPIMVNMDRLFVGSLLSVSAVTYYVTPFEAVSRLLIVPSAISNASFPEFSSRSGHPATASTRHYFWSTVRLVLYFLVPAAAVIMIAAHWLLALWVSPELADRSAGVMRLLAAGVVINGATYIPFAYVQGMGRSDVTARFHLIELMAYVPALYLLIGRFGLMGVALAWVLRVSLDAGLLFSYAVLHLRVESALGSPALDGAPRT